MTEAHKVSTEDACVIMRVFNEAPVLPSVLSEVRALFSDVICVDDGSTDGSGSVATATGARVVRHSRNLGGGAALATGLAFARLASSANYFVTFDADGQHRAQDAVAMVEQAKQLGVDVVLGSRFLGEARSKIPLNRELLLRAGVLFTRVTTGLPVSDTHNGLRVLSRRAIETIRLRQASMAYASELLEEVARHRLSYVEWPVAIEYTDYSLAKGQRNLNAVNIVLDVLTSKMRAPG